MDLPSDFSNDEEIVCDECGDVFRDGYVEYQICAACHEVRRLCRGCAKGDPFTDSSDRCAACVALGSDVVAAELPPELEARYEG